MSAGADPVPRTASALGPAFRDALKRHEQAIRELLANKRVPRESLHAALFAHLRAQRGDDRLLAQEALLLVVCGLSVLPVEAGA